MTTKRRMNFKLTPLVLVDLSITKQDLFEISTCSSCCHALIDIRSISPGRGDMLLLIFANIVQLRTLHISLFYN